MTRRKWIVIAVAGAAVLAVVLFFVLRKKPHERGFITGFQAVEAGGAMIVWRANPEKGPSIGWVTRVDALGGETWTRPLPHIAMNGGGGPLAIVDGVAIVRYGKGDSIDYDDNRGIAFDLETGDQLWDRVLAPFASNAEYNGHPIRLHGLPTYLSNLALGKHLIAFSDTGADDVVQAIVARTGAAAWEHPATEANYSPILIGTAGFALHYPGTATFTEVATGRVRRVAARGPGCVVGGEYIAVVPAADKSHALVAIRPDGTRSRVIAEPFVAFGAATTVRSCGRYGDRFVFLVEVFDPRARSIVITDAQGVKLHEIPIGDGISIMDDMQRLDPSRAYLSGDALPRFVPFPDSTMERDDTTLLMLDLETGTVAWRAPPDERLLHGTLLRAGTNWLWFDGAMGKETISVFDGATGKLVAATTAYSYNGIYSLGLGVLGHASHDTLWVSAGDWTTPDAAPIVALELPTLKPRFPPRIIELTDATQAVRAKLKLP